MERLREIRQRRGLSQKRLADLSGCSQQAIADYEKGKSAPGSDALRDIARVLRVHQDYLTGHSADPRLDTRLPDEWVEEVEALIDQGITLKEIRLALQMYQAALRRLGEEDPGRS